MDDMVLVFGFSENAERYSNMAYRLLLDHGYNVKTFNPRQDDVSQLTDHYHTLTLYLGEGISNRYLNQNLSLKFDRLIINPGAENEQLESLVSNSGREVVHGCTLVMLRTDQF